jgi:hypothetical protein
MDFSEAFSRVAPRQAEHGTAALLLHHIVFPVAIGLLGVASSWLWAVGPVIPISLWLFLLITYGLSWWKSGPRNKDVYELLNQKRLDDQKIKDQWENEKYLQSVVTNLSFKNVTSFALRAMSVEYVQEIRKSGVGRDYFAEMLDEVLSPLYNNGDSLFGFAISEKWNICVYLFNAKTKMLEPVWRRKSTSHPSVGLGRAWMPGEGHVGKAYLDRRPILTGNANDEAVAQLCRARPSKLASYDESTYVSFASVPISASEADDKDPVGVLVVTSDVEGRLAEESHTELLMHFAGTLSVIIELSSADVSCLFEPNHGTSK